MGEFSPDGRWIAYQSAETGRYEVYVRPFPAAVGKWQLSAGGGTNPRWRPDGKELFYLAPDRRLMAVELRSDGTTLEPSAPRTLFQTRISGPLGGGVRNNYAVSRDGQRFLIATDEVDHRSSPIIVVLNWTALLEQ